MRKLLSSLALLFATIPIFAQFSGSGSGTESSPYLIYNESQLAQVANFLGQEGVVFSLQKDLNVSTFIAENYPSQGWLPIGTSASPFKGVFKGNGHTISGLFINRSSTNYVGFFGYISGASITNLKINATYIKGKNYVGAIAGSCNNNCTISGCSAVFSLSPGISGNQYVGGIAGNVSSLNIENCNVQGSINATSDVGGIIGKCMNTNLTSVTFVGNINASGNVGGIVGTAYGSTIKSNIITSSYFHGKITNSGNNTGGIVGYETSCLGTSKCIFLGEISGVDYVGGIVGHTAEDISNTNNYAIDNCSAIGDITGNDAVGGIIGKNTALPITNSYYNGTLSAHDNVGGLVGHSYQNPQSITYCYSNANITGNNYVGGLVGKIDGSSTAKLTIKSNVAINPIINANSDYVGRIYGFGIYVENGASGTSEGNRALNQTIVKVNGVVKEEFSEVSANGMGLGPSMLKLKANYVAWGWDFNNNWTILETECFPYKKYQAAPPKIESDLVSNAGSISGNSHDGGTVYLCYKDNAPVSTTCNGNAWAFNTEPLQSGAQVRLYAETSSLKPSYYTTGTVGYSTNGTEEDPYLIYTAEDLQGATISGYYKLMNDIDLTSWINANSPTEGWPAVVQNGTEPTYIDGCGHKVTGLWANTTNDYAGLFSNFSAGGSIKNLTVEVASGKKVKGGNYTGILIGCMKNGEIINCSVKGNVEGTKYVGGLVGNFEGVLTNNAFIMSEVRSSGRNANIGGLVGYLSSGSVVTRCSATGTVYTDDYGVYAGGLIGFSAGSLEENYANTFVGGNCYSSRVGGLVGYNTSTIKRCHAEGIVEVSGIKSYAGGLVGYSEGEVNNCYATTNVTGTQYSAGLVGFSKGSISNCYASGDVNGVFYGAGVVGVLDGSNAQITNCVAANNIISLTDQSSWGCRVIGGFQNGAPEPGNNNYALSTMQVSLNGVPQTKTDDNLEGIAKTQQVLKKATTYKGLGWDFSSVWGIDEGQDYPYFLWEAEVNHEKVEQTLSLNEIPAMTYGDAEYQLPANTVEGLPLTWTSSNTSIATISGNVLTIKKVGDVDISCSQEGNGDYLPFSKSFPLTINKANLLITADSHTIIQGEEIPELTVQYEGFKYNDDVTCLTTLPSVTTTANSTSPIGTYPIIVSGAKAVNYNISYVNGTLSVVDAAIFNNTLYSGTVEIRTGGNSSISLELNNEDPIIMVEFFMQLPEGISISQDEDGYWDATLNSNRSNRHSIEVEKYNDGLYHFLVYSSRNNSFKENEGELINIKVECDESVVRGTYQVTLRNILLNDANKDEIVLPDYNFSMHVTDVLPGDVNGDWKINGSDIVEMVDHIMGRESDKFIAAAAELTGDGQINGSDLVEEISLVMSQGISQAPAALSNHAPMHLASGVALNSARYGEAVLSVGSDEGYILSQMTLHLSKGLNMTDITTDSRHTVVYRQVSEDTYLVLCYSSKNSAFCSNNQLLSIHYTGQGDIQVDNVMMVGIDKQETYFAPVCLNEATGIEWASQLLSQPSDIYSISGNMVKQQATTLKGLVKGVYLINGKKIILK